MGTECSMKRMPSTAAWSAASFSPRPTSGAAASAAASVTRTSSRARLRSGRWWVGSGLMDDGKRRGAARWGWRQRITTAPPLRSWTMSQSASATLPENPLSAGLERRPVAPTALVIFGATGDLARRKLLPALYNLAHEGALPERFHLVGVSRKEKAHEDYRAECEQAIRAFSRRTPDDDVLAGLLANVKYVPGV